MRKLFFLFAILGIAGLVACGGADTAAEEVQDEAAVAAAALQESITAFVDEVNAYKTDLDAQIAAATDEAAKTSLTEMRMKLDQMGSSASAATTVEEVEALKASFAEIKGMQSSEGEATEGATQQ